MLHPLAWWAWAAAMAVCAIKTTNPLLLAVISAVVVFVVASRRTAAPWARSFSFFFRLGVIVIVIRAAIEVLFGQRGLPGAVLFTIPRVPLPGWAKGVSIGGPVTSSALVGACLLGFQLAVILLCFGAANTLASPYRLLRSLPAVLYEAGVAVTVALAFAPEIVITIANVREARRLRGRPNRGVTGLRGMAVPVLEGALDRSLQLASSMDARGYGRRNDLTRAHRRLANGLIVGGLLVIVVGLYGVLDSGALGGLGLPVFALGMACCAASLLVGGRRTSRTRYRLDPWRWSEWAVLCSGAAAVAAVSVAEALGAAGIQYSATPLAMPRLPALACAGIVLGLLPAVASPRPPSFAPAAGGPPPAAAPPAADAALPVAAGMRGPGA
jgi:energy-coupling factor transport system permease protein